MGSDGADAVTGGILVDRIAALLHNFVFGVPAAAFNTHRIGAVKDSVGTAGNGERVSGGFFILPIEFAFRDHKLFS